MLVYTALLNVLTSTLFCFEGIDESIQSLLSVYRAENCQTGILKTVARARRIALLEGAAMTVFLLAFAEIVPRLLGVTEPELVAASATAVRIYAPAICFTALYVVDALYFIYMGKIRFSLWVAFLYNFGLPVALAVVFGTVWGIRGVWAAYAVAEVAGFVICRVAARRLYDGGAKLPLLDAGKLSRELSYDVPKTTASIGELVDRVERDLTERGVPRDKILKIMMMIDATEMYSMDGGDEQGVVVECTIFLEDVITLILRDDGKRTGVWIRRRRGAWANRSRCSAKFAERCSAVTTISATS